MGRSASLADAVASTVISELRTTWWESLTDAAKAELREVRSRFHAGAYGASKRLTIARHLHSHCRSREWKTCDARRLAEWLKSDD